MTRVDVKLNFSCNNRCVFCVQGDRRHKEKDKSIGEAKELLRKSVEKRREVVFTGGEVTTREDLAELVSYARKIGFKEVQIQSNGRRFFYKDYCRKLIDAGVTCFGLALHGPTAEIHDSLTRAKGSFLQTTTAIKNLKEMNQYVIMNCVITKKGYPYFPSLADLLIDLGVNQYQFAYIHINSIIKNDKVLIEEIVPKKSDIMPYIKEGLQKGIDSKTSVMTEAIPFCFMKDYEKYIAEYGKIPDADCYDGDQEILDYQNYRKNEGKAKGPECKKCKYFKICEGPWKEYPEIFGWDEFIPVVG